MNFKKIIFDFGFTLFYFENASVKKYHACFQRGLSKSVKRLRQEGIIMNDEIEKKFISLFNRKKARCFKESLKSKDEFPTTHIFQHVLDDMVKKGLLEEFGELNERFLKECANDYHSFEELEWLPFEKTVKTLEKLSVREDIKMAVLSNHPHHELIVNILERFDIARFFDVIITSAQFGKRKPHPDIFQHVINKMGVGVQPEDCLICGDEHADIVGGHRAGLQTILCERIYKFPFEREINIPNLIKIKDISRILDFLL